MLDGSTLAGFEKIEDGDASVLAVEKMDADEEASANGFEDGVKTDVNEEAAEDDFEVGNYHDDHQGSGRHGDGILLLHCSFSLMTNDPHMVLHIVSQFI